MDSKIARKKKIPELAVDSFVLVSIGIVFPCRSGFLHQKMRQKSPATACQLTACQPVTLAYWERSSAAPRYASRQKCIQYKSTLTSLQDDLRRLLAHSTSRPTSVTRLLAMAHTSAIAPGCYRTRPLLRVKLAGTGSALKPVLLPMCYLINVP
jgi:hypothetical protein